MYLPLNLRTRLLPNKLDSLLKLHSYKILDLFFFKKSLILDFPGGREDKKSTFHCRGHEFYPWSLREDSTSLWQLNPGWPQLLKFTSLDRACAPHQENPLQRRVALLSTTRESLHTAKKTKCS